MQVVNVNVYGGVQKAKRRGVIYCGRPSTLGNPEPLKSEDDREAAIERYRQWLLEMVEIGDEPVMDALRELQEDSILGCWCRPKACHCDVIVEVWRDLKQKGAI